MSVRASQCRAALVALVVLAASVTPWVAAASATTAPNASFEETVVREERGDVANITVETSKAATVNLGSAEKGFWMQVQVGSGTTELRVNTYKAGRQGYSLSEMVWASQGSVTGRTLRTARIDKPLESARYPMNVTINGAERALGALAVDPRSTNDITAGIAPRANDPTAVKTAADVRKAVTPPDGSVARGDWLFLYVNASGLHGSLSQNRLDGDGEAGYRVEFVQQDPEMNADPKEFTGDEVEWFTRPPNDEGFILGVDTSEHDIEPDETYEVSFVVPESSPLADSREEVSTAIQVTERRVSLDRKGPGKEVVVEGKTTITGTTTLTPGTTINVTARDSDGEPFHKPGVATVTENRTFAVTFDFTGIEPGREFDIRLPDQNRVVPGKVKPPETTQTTTTQTTTANRTTTQTPNQTTTGSQTTGTTTRTTDRTTGGTGGGSETTSNTPETTVKGLTQVPVDATERPLTQSGSENGSDGESDGSIPGFGAVASLVALLSAALLAVRRS